jgi:hypothetical protein
MFELEIPLAGGGSPWEVELARRCELDEAALEITWIVEQAAAFVGS